MTNPTNPALVDDIFTASWAIYRAIIEYDYLWHRAIEAGMRKLLDERFPGSTPIRFLDLACGDAASTSLMLRGRNITRYVGVDRSEPALALAKEQVRELGGSTEVIVSDYVEFLEQCRDEFDVIYVGLSAHHLGEPRLPQLFHAARPRLSSNGIFAAYEPFTLPDETRDEHIDRLCTTVERFYVRMPMEQRQQVIDHVRGNDFPIALARWNEIAADAGFSPALRQVRTADRLYELVAHTPIG